MTDRIGSHSSRTFFSSWRHQRVPPFLPCGSVILLEPSEQAAMLEQSNSAGGVLFCSVLEIKFDICIIHNRKCKFYIQMGTAKAVSLFIMVCGHGWQYSVLPDFLSHSFSRSVKDDGKITVLVLWGYFDRSQKENHFLFLFFFSAQKRPEGLLLFFCLFGLECFEVSMRLRTSVFNCKANFDYITTNFSLFLWIGILLNVKPILLT